jgi:hypothetical protein
LHPSIINNIFSSMDESVEMAEDDMVDFVGLPLDFHVTFSQRRRTSKVAGTSATASTIDQAAKIWN